MDEAPFSFTTKVNGDLLTVRGKDYDEFFVNVSGLSQDEELVKRLATLQRLAHGAVTAQATGGALPPDHAAAVAVARAGLGASPVEQTGSTGATFTCPHGVRVERSNKPGAAKKWTAYFCPNSAPDCKPMNADGTLWK